MNFEQLLFVAESRSAAKVGYAEVCTAVDADGNFVHALPDGIFPLGVFYVYRGEAEQCRAAPGAVHDGAFNIEVFAQQPTGTADVALFEAALYERGGYLFAFAHYVLYGHVPDAVVLVLGIIF